MKCIEAEGPASSLNHVAKGKEQNFHSHSNGLSLSSPRFSASKENLVKSLLRKDEEKNEMIEIRGRREERWH